MNVIYLNNRDRKKELNVELVKYVDTLKKINGVEKIILFGSLADGEIGIKSDLDLLVVQQTSLTFLNRSVELIKQLAPDVAVDILVYTPQEFAEMEKEPNRFMRKILETGRVLYEKQQGH